MIQCPICKANTESIGTIPFDTNCANISIVDKTPMEYVRCLMCSFITCPEMLTWSSEDFKNKIYNDKYTLYDPEYSNGVRNGNNVNFLSSLISPKCKRNIRHLDYGSGTGELVDSLKLLGFDSTAYDKYSNTKVPKGTFELVTAFEVIEHSPNVIETINYMLKYMSPNGVILFTTLLADSSTPIDWKYIAPRNGHISILSETSIRVVCKAARLYYIKFSDNTHVLTYNRKNIKTITNKEVKILNG